MKLTHLLFVSFWCLPLILCSYCTADEVVINKDNDSVCALGDFSCSHCPDCTRPTIAILNQESSGVVKAGELWKFFDGQGVESLDRLILCIDVCDLEENSFNLNAVEFRIQDPDSEGQLVTDVSLGDNTIIVNHEDTSSLRPEATLEFMLGYDFMDKFSAESQELVQLEFSADEHSKAQPTFTIGGASEVFSQTNLFLLIGFAAFWLVVFAVLNRLTKPAETELEDDLPSIVVAPQIAASPANTRAMSA